ncbi:hypothetical protein C8J56DRAFT_570393 [Mycena floridula]|nr:hypothetical protein C8J56DRAFT_570393 [Mycena floridula]
MKRPQTKRLLLYSPVRKNLTSSFLSSAHLHSFDNIHSFQVMPSTPSVAARRSKCLPLLEVPQAEPSTSKVFTDDDGAQIIHLEQKQARDASAPSSPVSQLFGFACDALLEEQDSPAVVFHAALRGEDQAQAVHARGTSLPQTLFISMLVTQEKAPQMVFRGVENDIKAHFLDAPFCRGLSPS